MTLVTMGTHLDLLTVFHTWASSRPVASDPHRGLSCLVTLVLTWPHLDLVTLLTTWLHLDLVTLVSTWTSPGSGDSGPHMDFSWTW